MPLDPTEKALRRLILSQQQKLDVLFTMLANNMSIAVGSIAPDGNYSHLYNLAKGNKIAKAKIDAVIFTYQRDLKRLIHQETYKAWKLNNSKYTPQVKTFLKGNKVPAGLKASMLSENTKAFRAFIKRDIKGLNLSKRVWKSAESVKDNMGYMLGEGIADGMPANQMATKLKQYLKNPNSHFKRVRNKKTGLLQLSKNAQAYHPGKGVYRSAYKNALRLSRNEVNIAYRTADFERREKLPFILGVTVNLSPQHPAYDICDEMKGDYPKKFKFTGWHPNCLCYTTTKQMTDNQFKKYLSGEEVKTSQRRFMPKNAEFHVANISHKLAGKSKPYFIADNFIMDKGLYRLRKTIGSRRNLATVPKPVPHAPIKVAPPYKPPVQAPVTVKQVAKKKIAENKDYILPNTVTKSLSEIEAQRMYDELTSLSQAGDYRARSITDTIKSGKSYLTSIHRNRVIPQLQFMGMERASEVYTYTTGAVYEQMNRMIRVRGWKKVIKMSEKRIIQKGRLLDKYIADSSEHAMSRYARRLQDTLNKLPNDTKGTYYRGVRRLPSDVLLRYEKAFKSKTIIQEEYFMSTSHNAPSAFSGEVKFVIKGKNGKRIDGISAHKGESEVMFNVDSRFRVTGYEKDKINSVIRIYLEEV